VVDPTPSFNGKAIVYAALSNGTTTAGGGLWRSTDSGDHWTLMRAGNATDVVLAPGSGAAGVGGANELTLVFAAFQGDGVYMNVKQGAPNSWKQMTGTLANGAQLLVNAN